ncbi:MAG: CPXCG motif-containing cysteine-rich protein, partial [Sinobacteraceae bacterium]|nr:CPXCG motif-containing cysteine-rich protein [Nevskiaceae bacterium]MBV9315842.1 CPXCG motif-containing cysteine-rich protein [Gammaproteobacteria bacterium]
LTTEEPGYVEDCEVCCRPIEFAIERDAAGGLVALQVRRLD